MTFKAAFGVAGWRGIDSVTAITSVTAPKLKASGIDFCMRYLGAVTPAERDIILEANLALGLVTYSRAPNWTPSAAIGSSDGLNAVRNAHNVGAPVGTTLWVDLEGCAGSVGLAEQYVDEWTTVVQAAGYQAGLYVGYESLPMTPEQLYNLAVTRYWHSVSIVPAVAKRGYCLIQGSPPNQMLDGIEVDVDTVLADELGGLPCFIVNIDTTIVPPAPDTIPVLA